MMTPARDDKSFALLAFAGLGDIAVEELGAGRSGGMAVGRLPNYDFLPCTLAPSEVARLPTLRTVEDVFWLMGRPQRVSARRDLSKLSSVVTRSAILYGLELRNQLFHPKKPKTPTFNCFVKQDRDRAVYRKDIAGRINAGIAAAFGKWKNTDPASIELWAFYIDEFLHLGFRLSDEKMKYRGTKPIRREGALRPTVAAAMIHVAAPRKGESVLDPMCGTGTILAEGIAQGTGAFFTGGDIDTEAVELTMQRLNGREAKVQEWDATKLPLDASSADCIVCNLPFGKQYSTETENRTLYPALVRSWTEKLKPGGRMILLTSDGTTLERALKQQGLSWSVASKVKVLGVWAKIYRIRKHQ